MSQDGESYQEGLIDDVDEEIMTIDDDPDSDDIVSEGEEEESIINKLKKSNKSNIVPVNKTYDIYYSEVKKTSPFLTKFEKAKLIGTRAEMISAGSPALVTVPEGVTSAYDIAIIEFNQKKIPLMIKRFLANGDCEYVRLEDLTIL